MGNSYEKNEHGGFQVTIKSGLFPVSVRKEKEAGAGDKSEARKQSQ